VSLAELFAGFALVLAACGGGSSDSGGAGNGGSNDAAPTTSGPGSGDSGGSGRADVDCAAIAEAQVELVQVQLLAQLRDPDSIETLRSGTIGSPVEFLGRQAAIAGALDEAGC